MDAAELEQLLRAELKLRDQRIAARAFHPGQRILADEAFIAAVMTAAGHDIPDDGKKLAKARRARQRDEDRAFAGKAG